MEEKTILIIPGAGGIKISVNGVVFEKPMSPAQMISLAKIILDEACESTLDARSK